MREKYIEFFCSLYGGRYTMNETEYIKIITNGVPLLIDFFNDDYWVYVYNLDSSYMRLFSLSDFDLFEAYILNYGKPLPRIKRIS